MKKMILGFTAALLSGAVMAIESANIVGYQTKEVVSGGFNYVTPTFLPMTGTAVDIQNIKLGEGASDYADNIQIWDEGGVTIANYFWVEGAWYDENFDNPVEGVTVKSGTSFVIECMEDTSVTFAGTVADSDIEVPSVTGFTMVGNASPVDVNVQDIKLGEGASDYADNIQIWDEGGVTIANYFWVDGAWYDENFDNPVEGITIKAGQGFVVEAMELATPVIIPSAL